MACGPDDTTNCPEKEGPDHDFGQSPILVTLGNGRRVLVAGQKSGVVHGFDPDQRGKKLWSTTVGRGVIDVVVVYKLYRLSRALMDFSKLVEVFDRNNVTFVSVTQSFNTTTSMGRLTLNILLSFAQFEREVIGERIRDKFAASRARGIWMGGWAPLGYDVRIVQ